MLAIKKKIIPLICHDMVGRAMAFGLRDRLPHHGCTIHTAHPAITPGAKARLVWGLYEKAETQFVKRHLPDDLDVVELGSSLGVVSAHIARKLRPGRRLICVEANPHLAADIAVNVRSNAPDQRLDVITAAIDYSGLERVSFQLETMNVDSRVAKVDGGANIVSVPALTLSAVLEMHALSAYSLVMDIEGAEAAILSLDSDALANCQTIIAELHPGNEGDRSFTVASMATTIEAELGFDRVEQRGDVFAFTRLPLNR